MLCLVDENKVGGLLYTYTVRVEKNPLDYAKLDTGRVHPLAFRVGSGRVKSDPCLILGPRGARCEEDYGILALKLRRFR